MKRSLVFLLASAGCSTLPDAPVQRALYSDVRQVVETRERIGWVIDSSEVEAAAPSVLQSICQAHEEERMALLDWLDRRIDEEGGPASEAYVRAGEDLGEVEELLTLERMRSTLGYAETRTGRDCPFWLPPDHEFAGVQTDTHRFLLLGESIGGLALLVRGDRVLLGGGGGLRLLPAYGFSDRFTAGLGLEFGGNGAVSQGEEGEQTVQARPTGAVPLLLRLHDDTWVYDLELAPLWQYADGEVSDLPGIRVAPGVGVGSVRIGGLMPMAVGIIAYEFYPEVGSQPETHGIRVGTRVGLNFDPSGP